MSKTLLAGPFVGEMGWELFGWQGYLRALSERYDKTIVITRPLNAAIYADFATEVVSYIPSTNKSNYNKCVDELPENYYEQFDYDDIIPSQTQLVHWSPSKGNWGVNKKYIPQGVQQKFIRFGQKAEKEYDIIIHARNTSKLNSGNRNWGYKNWDKLVQNLHEFKIACVGMPDSSIYVSGTDDMRGVGMQRLMNLMVNSSLVVGGSSGPLHLASLCDTPHLVWSHRINRNRYLRDWRPFDTECIFVDQWGWKPPPQEIEKLILNCSEFPNS